MCSCVNCNRHSQTESLKIYSITLRESTGYAYITIAIRLRYDDTTTHSTTTEVIEITICVRFDCGTTTTRLRRKIDMFIFACVELRRMEAGAHDTSSQSDRIVGS